MNTMEVKEAAALLKMDTGRLRQLARNGDIPAAKPGKKWVFVEVDLIAWLRSKYKSQAVVGDSVERSQSCHSSNAKTHQIGGSNLLRPMENEYRKALGLK